MPFITEEIWQALVNDGTAIMVQDFPTYDEALDFGAEETEFEKIITAIRAIRNCRSELNVPPSKKAKLYIETAEPEVFAKGEMFFKSLASASEVNITDRFDGKDCRTAVTDSARFFIPLSEIIDSDKERARLEKEKQKVQKDLDFLRGKLNNQGFISKAPEKLIETEKEKLRKAEEKMAKIEESLNALV